MQDADHAPTEARFIETDTLRFEVDICGDPTSRRLALCLHGFPEHAYSWRHQLPLLARLGYRVWAPNQRGYGRTTRPADAASYGLDRLLDDVAALIDAADCDEVTLIGHDWGGIVAWSFALGRVRPLERLIVMNLPHPAKMLQNLPLSRQTLRSWYVFFFQLPRLPEMLLTARGARAVGEAFRGMAVNESRFPDDVLDFYRGHALQPGVATAMVNWYRGLRRSRPLLQRLIDAPAIEIPTLMVWGEQDSALGVELTYGTEDLVSDLTLRYLAHASHWVQQDAPEDVNAIVEAWLTDEPVPGAAQSSDQLGRRA
jgi:pimeloyl-ACP methyl ester carboxylesterase